MVILGASNLLPYSVFILFLLSVMFKKNSKRNNEKLAGVFGTKQMVQVSHRVEIKNKSMFLLAQEHTKDASQQGKNCLPEQTKSSGE